jgi:hypothetical protein
LRQDEPPQQIHHDHPFDVDLDGSLSLVRSCGSCAR